MNGPLHFGVQRWGDICDITAQTGTPSAWKRQGEQSTGGQAYRRHVMSRAESPPGRDSPAPAPLPSPRRPLRVAHKAAPGDSSFP